MRMAILFVASALLAGQQQSFEVASVKPSSRLLGPDYGNKLIYQPNGFSAQNATLKRLIAEAYQVQPFQVAGPKWLDSNEYDVAARSGNSTNREDLRTRLQDLLAARFHLVLHRETREMRVYNLAGKGSKLKQGASSSSGFHGDLDHFAGFLAVQLSIHGMEDPTRPGIAASPVPVLNRTGLTGEYDIDVNIQPEPGADMYTLWQRALREKLDLHLESTKAPVEMLLIDSANKMPSAN